MVGDGKKRKEKKVKLIIIMRGYVKKLNGRGN